MSDRHIGPPDNEGMSNQTVDSGASRQQMAGQLAAAVAHDLNNLLATILGCLELMERRFEDPDRLKALIKRSSGAVERAASLTSRLAQFVRRQPQPKTFVDVDVLIADLMPLVISALGRRVRVSAETSSVPAWAAVDLAGLEATLLALCMAARAALPETGSVTLTTQVSGSRIAVSVSVTGSGLKQLDLAQARRIASAADLAIQSVPTAENAVVTVLSSPSSHDVDASTLSPDAAPTSNPATSIRCEQ